jgi:hypothetical protein
MTTRNNLVKALILCCGSTLLSHGVQAESVDQRYILSFKSSHRLADAVIYVNGQRADDIRILPTQAMNMPLSLLHDGVINEVRVEGSIPEGLSINVTRSGEVLCSAQLEAGVALCNFEANVPYLALRTWIGDDLDPLPCVSLRDAFDILPAMQAQAKFGFSRSYHLNHIESCVPGTQIQLGTGEGYIIHFKSGYEGFEFEKGSPEMMIVTEGQSSGGAIGVASSAGFSPLGFISEDDMKGLLSSTD